jgi:hypothetical protein
MRGLCLIDSHFLGAFVNCLINVKIDRRLTSISKLHFGI